MKKAQDEKTQQKANEEAATEAKKAEKSPNDSEKQTQTKICKKSKGKFVAKKFWTNEIIAGATSEIIPRVRGTQAPLTGTPECGSECLYKDG